VATHDDKHPEMLDEELRPLQMHLDLYDFVHRQGEWAPVEAFSLGRVVGDPESSGGSFGHARWTIPYL
jgi:hypothetical protein